MITKCSGTSRSRGKTPEPSYSAELRLVGSKHLLLVAMDHEDFYVQGFGVQKAAIGRPTGICSNL